MPAFSRRSFLISPAAAAVGGLLPRALRAQTAPATITRDGARPLLLSGLQSGDVLADRAIVWVRASRPARTWLQWSTTAGFVNVTNVRGPDLLPDSNDGTGRVELRNLPAGQEIFYRLMLEDPDRSTVRSPLAQGHFRTPQSGAAQATRPLRLVWSGDTAGQGFGINQAIGGMRIYEAMRKTNPDLFLHCGDTVYADGPIPAEIRLPDGSSWRNVVTPEVGKVAETLDEFRGRHRYNLMDANVRAFNSEVAQVWQWDDHEVANNYSNSKSVMDDARYTEKNVHLLAARGQRAFMEYAPMRPFGAAEPQRVYRQIPQGPLADLFVLDMRSYRGSNGENLQTEESHDTDFLGRPQVDWLLAGLKRSRAAWKIIAADMPISLLVPDGTDAQDRTRWEAVANGDPGAPRGREIEIARLLAGIKDAGVKNVVWLTADVHYTAAHHYSPERARFQDFDPFWEFVSGPLNAGGFGPNEMDPTFGGEVVYQKSADHQNSAPTEGCQFFGQVDIDHRSRAMTVTLKDLDGRALFARTLPART